MRMQESFSARWKYPDGIFKLRLVDWQIVACDDIFAKPFSAFRLNGDFSFCQMVNNLRCQKHKGSLSIPRQRGQLKSIIAKFQISHQTAPTWEPIKLKIKRWEKKTVDGGVLDVKEFFGGKWGELFQNNPARHNGTAHISSVLCKCKISGKILLCFVIGLKWFSAKEIEFKLIKTM